MTLSRRCWRVVYRRLPENGIGVTERIRAKLDAAEVWRHKRHSFLTLNLLFDEQRLVVAMMRTPGDPYFAFVVDHETRTNPTLGGIVL